MARIKKVRTICAAPRFRRFSPTDQTGQDAVEMTYDEFEVLRLHDLMHMTQETVARQMQVSRPTVTEMLSSAHEKIADAIVNGKQILLRHGGCAICEIGQSCSHSGKPECPKKHCCGASCRFGDTETNNNL